MMATWDITRHSDTSSLLVGTITYYCKLQTRRDSPDSWLCDMHVDHPLCTVSGTLQTNNISAHSIFDHSLRLGKQGDGQVCTSSMDAQNRTNASVSTIMITSGIGRFLMSCLLLYSDHHLPRTSSSLSGIRLEGIHDKKGEAQQSSAERQCCCRLRRSSSDALPRRCGNLCQGFSLPL